jgi:hypothetical protein
MQRRLNRAPIFVLFCRQTQIRLEAGDARIGKVDHLVRRRLAVIVAVASIALAPDGTIAVAQSVSTANAIAYVRVRKEDDIVGRSILLWMLGVPLPIIILVALILR